MEHLLNTLEHVGVLVAVVVAILALVRDQRRRQLIEIQQKLYEAQKEATVLSEKKREEERTECDAKIHELQGRVAVLESTWQKSIGEGVATAVTTYLDAHLKKGY